MRRITLRRSAQRARERLRPAHDIVMLAIVKEQRCRIDGSIGWVCTLANGGTLFQSYPLQRRLRDIEIAAQHAAAVQQRYYARAGKLLLSPTSGPHD